MRLSIISASEKELLSKIAASNDPDISVWRISNVMIPLASILLSLIAFAVFKTGKTTQFIAYFNLILNGSIPMIALNRIGAMGIYLFKYDRSKEAKYGIADTYYLRTKLFFIFLGVLLGTIILYVYQVLTNPFDYSWQLLITLVLSILSVYFSLQVARNVYLLQDKLMETTFEQEIREDMKEKGHGQNW